MCPFLSIHPVKIVAYTLPVSVCVGSTFSSLTFPQEQCRLTPEAEAELEQLNTALAKDDKALAKVTTPRVDRGYVSLDEKCSPCGVQRESV